MGPGWQAIGCMILGALLVSTLTAGFGRTIDIRPEEQKVLLAMRFLMTSSHG